MDVILLRQLALALGLGLLVGLQREWRRERLGIRTFPLITLFGTLTAALGPIAFSVGLLSLGLVVVVSARTVSTDDRKFGTTTEVAALLLYAVGGFLAEGRSVTAIAVAGTTAILLQWKEGLHRFVERIGAEEMRAIFRLVLVAMVVLPLLPDRAYGPYDVLNPFRIWLMVVLIVGISVGGYLASRFLGGTASAGVAGFLGGVISSTATTVSYARRSRRGGEGLAGFVIVLASAVVFARVALEVALVAPRILPAVLPPFAVMGTVLAVLAVLAYRGQGEGGGQVESGGDPSDLKAAIVFGVLYGAVLLAVAVAKAHFGERGLYVVAGLSGLTDMDAITLSTAEMMRAGRVEIDTGWRMMLVGALSNLVFKAVLVAVLGPPRLALRIGVPFAVALGAGALLLLFWPGSA